MLQTELALKQPASLHPPTTPGRQVLKRKGAAKDAEKGEQKLSVYNYAPDPADPASLAAWAAQGQDPALAALLAADAARAARWVVDVEVRGGPVLGVGSQAHGRVLHTALASH